MSSSQKPLQWAVLPENNAVVLQLSGELSRNTLLPLWSQRSAFLADDIFSYQRICWDLKQLKRIDSAGFAFLCELLQHCQSKRMQGASVCLVGAPAQLFTLSDLFGLSHWIKSFSYSST